MSTAQPEPTHLIIGGTIKGATSSVFTYLAAHPQVRASAVKETFFFSHHCSGDVARDRARYARYFNPPGAATVLLEASPNYLGFIEDVAPRIARTVPEARLMFILRNPVERACSHFAFARGKLELPDTMGIEDFLGLCEDYSRGAIDAREAGIPLKHLRALEIGRYAHWLERFYAVFDSARVKVMFVDALRADAVAFMREACTFAGLDAGFYDAYRFRHVNVTMAGKRRRLHALAMAANRSLERTLRRHPGLKQGLVRAYRAINEQRRDDAPLPAATRARLEAFYAPANLQLRRLLDGHDLPKWLE